MVDILIRIRNEAEWLVLLLNSIQSQVDIDVNTICVLDNGSEDDVRSVINFFPDLNVSYHSYSRDYVPGQMLNYGIELLLEKENPGSCVVIVSAHCYMKNNISLRKLIDPIEKSSGIRASFGRQVPMNISDPQAIRDLTLMYPNESRVISEVGIFNNAFSAISYEALSQHKFHEGASNLEDVIWAAEEINLGYKISYQADAEVIHYHGPHHSNNNRRLHDTGKVIKAFENIFHTQLHEPYIYSEMIVPLFFGVPRDKALFQHLYSLLNHTKCYLIINENESIDKSLLQDNLVVIKQPKEYQNKALYGMFDFLDAELIKYNEFSPYLISYDNSFNSTYPIVDLERACTAIREDFGLVYWPVYSSTDIVFSLINNEVFSNLNLTDMVDNKLSNYVVVRGNGFVISRKVFKKASLIHKSPKFIELDYEG